MASNAPIVVNDGQASPVAHTFSPAGVIGESARYQNSAELLLQGREILTLSRSVGKKTRDPSFGLYMPYVVDETMNAVTNRKVASFASIKVVSHIPFDWTPAMTKNLRVLAANALLHATVVALMEQDEFVW